MSYYACRDSIVIDLLHEVWLLREYSGKTTGRNNKREKQLLGKLKERLATINPGWIGGLVPSCEVVYGGDGDNVWIFSRTKNGP